MDNRFPVWALYLLHKVGNDFAFYMSYINLKSSGCCRDIVQSFFNLFQNHHICFVLTVEIGVNSAEPIFQLIVSYGQHALQTPEDHAFLIQK